MPISEQTLAEIGAVELGPRPLLICDVDDVVVHFLRRLEAFLADRNLALHPDSFALNGNVRSRETGKAVSAETVKELVACFFAEETLNLEAIKGAVESLERISRRADIVMLTNLPRSAKEHRVANLAGHGLEFPVIVNSGPKGPAIRHLASRAQGPVVFIDDSPNFIASANEHAPDVHLVHFLQDPRFARHVPEADYVSLRTGDWIQACPHILALIGG